MQPNGPIIKGQLIKKNTSTTIHNLRCQILKKLDFFLPVPKQPRSTILYQFPTTTASHSHHKHSHEKSWSQNERKVWQWRLGRWVCWRDLLDWRDYGGSAPKMAKSSAHFRQRDFIISMVFQFFFFLCGFWLLGFFLLFSFCHFLFCFWFQVDFV